MQTVNLKVGQSLDCPSSGLTKRNYTLAAGESIVDTIPQSMIVSVYPDELYFSIENLEAPVKMKVEMVERPTVPVISDTENFKELHVTDTIEPLAAKTYYRIKVADMDSMAKYEPEFTYRNVGTTPAKVTIKMAFEVPAYGTSNTTYELAPGEEQIVVYKKNMLDGMQGTEYIYLLTEVTGDVNFYGRFKHVREGKACKTNIDFNWETGHTQEARTTQWYAINVAGILLPVYRRTGADSYDCCRWSRVYSYPRLFDVFDVDRYRLARSGDQRGSEVLGYHQAGANQRAG